MNGLMYRNILETHMLPHAQNKMSDEWIFQHDNDPKHTSNLVKAWLADNNVNVLPWPAQSPDLNPIEHLWMEIKRLLSNKKIKNESHLMDEITYEWNRMCQNKIATLVDSMPNRCQEVIRAKGFATKY
jgi:hypothetical protein